jgi:hypothetical protein
MPKQRQLNGKAQLIGGAAACRHEILVGPGEGVLPRQSSGSSGMPKNSRRSRP